MIKKCVLIFTTIALSVSSNAISNQKYSIVYKRKITKKWDKIKNNQPAIVTISPNKKIFVFTEFTNKAILSFSDISLKKGKSIIIPRNLLGSLKKTGSFHLTPMLGDEILIQGYSRRQTSKQSHLDIVALLYDKNLKLKKKQLIPQIGFLLPHLDPKQDFYYLFGNYKKIITKPIIKKNYLLQVPLRNKHTKTIFMKHQSTNVLLSVPERGEFNRYDNKTYIVTSERDIFDSKNHSVTGNNLWGETKSNIGIYLLSPEKKTFKKISDLTIRVNSAFKKYNNRLPNSLLKIWSSYFDFEKKSLVFKIREYSQSTTCSTVSSEYLAYYSIIDKKFLMIKLDREFKNTILVGYIDGISYLYNWNSGYLYGLRTK